MFYRFRIRSFRARFAFAAVAGFVSVLSIIPSAASATSRGSGSFPVTLKYPGGTVTITHRPTRIISLSPSATEDLFAIGAGRQVVAVDNDSNYPKNAPHSALSGYQPNVEAVARYQPDLVVVVGDEGGLIAALAKIHIPVIVEPAANTISNAYTEIASIGRATGNRAKAQAVIATMRAQLASIVAGAPAAARHRSYYAELDQTYYSVTSSTFLGSVFSLFGLKNIADRASGAASGYPQLSSEYIVAANPNLIFLADTICCGQSPKTVKARAGWSTMTAVKKGDIVALNDDIASRWGPRIVLLAQDIRNALVRIYGKS
ncbi:MAG TPA: ABC transporter substrate-binding protein [Acidimicrobiales bacterium]|nr:ABC transporter substrate-binding protein [Acidimicrobiales bacterium]